MWVTNLNNPSLFLNFWTFGDDSEDCGVEVVEDATRQRDPEYLSHKLEESYSEEPLDQEHLCWTIV